MDELLDLPLSKVEFISDAYELGLLFGSWHPAAAASDLCSVGGTPVPGSWRADKLVHSVEQ